jgi:hypothetical protein
MLQNIPIGVEARRGYGYASYKVADSVTTHEAWGLGVCCVFYAAPVMAENAIETPAAPGVKMYHPATIRLGGQRSSSINHVINGTGSPVVTWTNSHLWEPDSG